MSLNKFVPPEALSSSVRETSPDYRGLVRFLIEPFLESPDSLSVDCEEANSKERVWIRLAFEGEDKGRVFGRGGRNIQAIRTLLEAIARASGQSVYLDIYEEAGETSRSNGASAGRSGAKRGSRTRFSKPKSTPKPRLK